MLHKMCVSVCMRLKSVTKKEYYEI